MRGLDTPQLLLLLLLPLMLLLLLLLQALRQLARRHGLRRLNG
jgi:hypothetical protein